MPMRDDYYSVDFSSLKRDWIIILIILLCIVAGFVVFPHLPERVPSHWNIRGEVDGYSGRWFGAFGIPAMTAGIYVLMVLLPLVDPKRKNYAKFSGVYSIFKLAFVLFMGGLYLVTIAAALGYNVDVGLLIPLFLSLLFIVMGNTMGRIKHNYFVGIKTPWTLADEDVWKKTHRLGGRLYVASGVVTMAALLISRSVVFWVFIITIIGANVIAAVYSYLLYKRVVN